MGILPSAQLGSVATVNVPLFYNEGGKVKVFGIVNDLFTTSPLNIGRSSASTSDPLVVTSKNGNPIPSDSTMAVHMEDLIKRLSASFDILSFRIANAIQRMREIQQCAGQGYKEQLEARWNVKLSTALSDHCTYTGGNSSQINISEVLNNNLDTAQSQADIKGKGVGSGSGSEFFETQEHGILMCIYHAVPVLDYELSGPDLQLLNTYAPIVTGKQHLYL